MVRELNQSSTTMRRFSGTVGLAFVLLGVSIAAGTQQAVSRAPIVTSGSERVLEVKEGYASYYGRRFDGKTTASGAVFDNGTMIAAHPVYSFGTVVRVTNVQTQRSVNVLIVDRGPSRAVRARGIIIDLSHAAAQRLGFIEGGRTRVRVKVLTWGR